MSRVFERELHLHGYSKVNVYTDNSVIAFEENEGPAWVIDPDPAYPSWVSDGSDTITLGAEDVRLLAPVELVVAAGIEPTK